MSDTAFLRITGPDATRWLNGMVTNSVKDLQPGESNYNFLLNAQGRIQGDATVYRDGDTYLLATGADQLETIQNHLDRFIIMDDVELTPVPAESIPAEFRKRLDPEISEADRIFRGIPRYGVDIRDRDLPQETNQPHALHFNKGCYLGQEIVERIRSRGQVHRLFTRFELQGDLPTELPTPLEANGKPAGELTSATAIEGKLYALGYARREALDLKQPLTYPGGTAHPRT